MGVNLYAPERSHPVLAVSIWWNTVKHTRLRENGGGHPMETPFVVHP